MRPEESIGILRSALLVALSSGAGGALRYLTGRWLQPVMSGTFPLATFCVNLAGCLLIGYVSGLSSRPNGLSPALTLLLTTGFCGGFTTFSAFSWENIQLIRSGHWAAAIMYISASLTLGLLAAWMGWQLSNKG